MPAGQILQKALEDLLFSLSQGYQAQGQARGAQGRSLGIGAALGGAALRQQILEAQRKEEEDRQAKMRELQDVALGRQQDRALKLREALQGTRAPEITAPAAPMMPSDVGGGGAGLQPEGTRQVPMPLPSVQYPTGEKTSVPLPVTSAQQAREMAMNDLREKLGIQQEFAKPQMDIGTFGYNGTGLYEKTTGGILRQPQEQPGPRETTPASINEYRFYVEQEAQAGRKPLSFDEWQNRDANRRIPTPTPTTALIDDPKNPGRQILVTVDKNGAKATPVTIGGEAATKRTAQEENRASQAEIVSNYADHIIDLINKSPNAVGPVVGRIARGETRLGTVSPDAKAIGTALGSFIALQPILHGFRGGSQTVEHFNGVLGDQSLNAAALKASLIEIKNLAQQIKQGGDADIKAETLDDALDKAFGKKPTPKGKP